MKNNHIQKLLKKKVDECLKPDSSQKPGELRYAVINEIWDVGGASVRKTADGIIVYYCRLPQTHRIRLSFKKITYGDGVCVTLKVYWGDYAYEVSSDWYRHRLALDNLKLLFSEYPAISDLMDKQAPLLAKKEKKREDNALKRTKATEIRIGTIKAWLSVLCGDLEYPYYIHQMKTRFDLYLLMPDNTRAVFQIPVNRFEDVVSQMPALIRQFVDMHKNKNIKVLLLNPEYNQRTRWTTKKNDG